MNLALIIIAGIAVLLWAITRFYLRGPDHSRFDQAKGSLNLPPPPPPSAEHHEVVRSLGELQSQRTGQSFKERLQSMREAMDNMGKDADISGVTITPVNVDGVPAEWICAPNSDPDRRLLYIHGGAFMLGSPVSHRLVTSRYALMDGCSVLAIDYRLMPENKRLDCLTDCQTAYKWILHNGPNGQAPLDSLVVSGDSAGGNLTLCLLQWARDNRVRPADAAVALSPATDNTLGSPSLRENLPTDAMLGPTFGAVAKLPRSAWLWISAFVARCHPCDPRISPLHGRLDNLPPTLVHASHAEMLLDDARRYVNKAVAAGSDASLETWHHVVHVWHIFAGVLPEADEAFEHIATFLRMNVPHKNQ